MQQPVFRLILFLFLGLSFSCYAQRDTAYIAPIAHEFSAGVFPFFKFTSLTHVMDAKNSTTLQANNPAGIGLLVAYKDFSIGFGMAFNFMRDKERGNSRVIDWQYHHYGKKFVFDLFFGNYKGFYTENDDETFTIYPDVKLVQYGISGQYIFNHKKYSYRAAFTLREQQLKSAGSFHAGIGFFYNHIYIPTDEQSQLDNYLFSMSGGYCYTYLIRKNFYITGDISVGVNLGTEKSNDEQKFVVLPNVLPRFSTVYNTKNWSFGLSYVSNHMYVNRTNDISLLLDTGYIRMTFIKRFAVGPKFLQQIKWIN